MLQKEKSESRQQRPQVTTWDQPESPQSNLHEVPRDDRGSIHKTPFIAIKPTLKARLWREKPGDLNQHDSNKPVLPFKRR